jgi:AcrR family transcriptional regulator
MSSGYVHTFGDHKVNRRFHDLATGAADLDGFPVQETNRRAFGPPVPVQERKQSRERGWYEALREQDQRTRITQALVEVLAERWFASATVGLVVRRAGVSTRTFYRHFDGLEACLITIMDSVLEEAGALVARELQGTDCWQDRIRSALAAVLSYFDRQPEMARVCIVETLAGGPVVLAHRERLIEECRLLIIERIDREVPDISPLAVEGAMSLVLGMMHAHIVRAKPGLLIELLGPLLGMAMAPYLGASGVQQEIKQGDELARAILAGKFRWATPAQAQDQAIEQASALAALASNVNTRRAQECLFFLAEHPDASNREIAMGLDIAHQSQISKLLAYLFHIGLATKRSKGSGKRNEWRLTPQGKEVAGVLSSYGGIVRNDHSC